MKKDLTRLLTLIFLGGITYMVYVMLADVNYMTDLVHAYIQMAVGHMRH